MSQFKIDEVVSGLLKNTVSAVVPTGDNVDLNAPTVITTTPLGSTVAPPTYELSAPDNVNEGESFTVELFTSNLATGSRVAYEITGVDLSDLVGETSLTGELVITAGNASKTLTLANDSLTEGTETLNFTIPGAAVASITINDTSLTPTYSLSASSTLINEGSAVTITLTTQNVSNGTTVPYSISGVNSADISGANTTGNFTVQSNSASVTITIAEDLTTEGTETLTLSLNNGADSIDITVNDTSTTPPPEYNLLANTTSINEGSSVTFTVITQFVPNGTTLYWTTSGSGITSGDFTDGTLTGSVTINSNTASFTRTLRNDATTEGLETFSVSLRITNISGTVVAGPVEVDVSDTSTTPLPTVDSISWSPSAINVGESSRLTWNTTDADSVTYSTPFGSGSGSLDGQSPAFTVNNAGSYTGAVIATNVSGSDSDAASLTVLATPTYSLSFNRISLNETTTRSFTATVTTANVPNNTTLYYTMTGSGINSNDFTSPTAGGLTINNNSGSVTITVAQDETTEGTEVFTFSLRTGSTSGPTVASQSLTISDTSQDPPPPPTYSLSITPSTTINETSSSSFIATVNTTNVANGTTLYYSMSGSGITAADFANVSSLTGSFPAISSNQAARFFTIEEDNTTEGTETITFRVRTGSTSGPTVASTTVRILDTSVTCVDSTKFDSARGTYLAEGAIYFNNGSRVVGYFVEMPPSVRGPLNPLGARLQAAYEAGGRKYPDESGYNFWWDEYFRNGGTSEFTINEAALAPIENAIRVGVANDIASKGGVDIEASICTLRALGYNI